MQEVYDFLRKCGTYYLATTEDGQPRVRPFGTAAIFEDRLYIQCDKNKAVSRQMAQNPHVELCAYDGETWLRLRAVAVNDERREAKKHMLDTFPFLRSSYAEDDGNTQVLYLKDAVATFEVFGGEKRSLTF